ncbi:MAG: hypothetical protein A3G59_03170 [Candidatus Taylorbacteria bacterium RIFCSPLOWO2_12_FULL_47_20]|uniref:Dihydrofolate reductase n=2 Tax=Candidatus Tayloriibacteriota TaxID=1817919 RepID=A0A1G2PB90_9BACT|nr:MAG: hypothetical protein A3H68_03540 [Candidatus Taylorbacteria bacterium RIFCSPLOWO2_02_FULL_46_40]OHA45588.1 MAG: hypothetical protein A3G59_03170 [Candidatus Taylorbacteria bacterium RIFCSPLOWO2_12_FULL_47_20]
MTVSLIAAVAKNGAIGNKGKIPWRLSDDMKYFATVTNGHTVIMGRKTYESILKHLGKPLPNRTNIVVTKQENFNASGCIIAENLDAAIKAVLSEKIFVIGGSQIYEAALPFADKLYITHVDAETDGDAFFPKIDHRKWVKTWEECHTKDDKNDYNYCFAIYERRR